MSPGCDFYLFLLQSELDLEKGLEMRKWVLSGILASEETYLSHLEALLLVRRVQGAQRGWGRGTGRSLLTQPRLQVSWRSPGAPPPLGVIETPVGRVRTSHLCRSQSSPRLAL